MSVKASARVGGSDRGRFVWGNVDFMGSVMGLRWMATGRCGGASAADRAFPCEPDPFFRAQFLKTPIRIRRTEHRLGCSRAD